MNVKWVVKKLLRSRGYDIVSYDTPFHRMRRKKLLSSLGITLVIDIGANVGQYGETLRNLGYKGRIASFEPQYLAFHELSRRAYCDHDWLTVKAAVGKEGGEADIFITENSVSSSLREPTEVNTIKPEHQVKEVDRVPVIQAEKAIRSFYRGDRLWLKIDAEGSERDIVDGSGDALRLATVVQMELSSVERYRGETLIPAMMAVMAEKGFRLCGLEVDGYGGNNTPGMFDGEITQADFLFLNQNLIGGNQ